LHRWTQIVGKVRMALTPPVNHRWNVTLYVTSRGQRLGLTVCGKFQTARPAAAVGRSLGCGQLAYSLAREMAFLKPLPSVWVRESLHAHIYRGIASKNYDDRSTL
jgi:hypothetical protein